jgi:uncharacterized paraquat-inducible protein A
MSRDTSYTQSPICPGCGHVIQDAWELDFGPCLEGEAEIECDRCGVAIKIERQCDVTYTTALRTPEAVR